MGTPASPVFLLDRKWPFRVALGVWMAIGVAVWFLADDLSRPGQVVLGGLWVVGLALLVRQFILSLFGPVLAYDALRVGRQPRRIWFRVAFAVLLAMLFVWTYVTWDAFRSNRVIQPKDLSKLAEMYFSIYMVVQFIFICLLTPASVGGAIAEEKERRTLEFLLATDLRDREILFGKLASRIGGLILFLLAGLPVLALMQFFGGIDPELVLAGFAATLLTMFSLAAIAIAASVMSRKARDAIALTYLVSVAYALGSIIVYAVSMPRAPLFWTLNVFGYPVTSEEVFYPLIAGNPFFVVPYVIETRGRGSDLFTSLYHYTMFHGALIAICVAWAGWRLRAIALAQMFGSGRRPFFRRLFKPGPSAKAISRPRARKQPTRPDVGDYPVLWKEVFVDTGLKLGLVGRVIVIGLVALSIVPTFLIFWFSFIDGPSYSRRDPWDEFGVGMNHYLRVAGTVAATLVLLAVAIRGAGAVSGERDRHTLDALLTTPMSARSIIWGKWWGCLLGMRWAWAWILLLWTITLGSGGVHPIMFLAAAISIAVYASGFAWIGLFCSLQMKTTLRATMAAILASVFIGGGYFLVFVLCCVVPLSFGSDPDRDVAGLSINFLSSFSPPVNLAWLPIHEFDGRELTMSHRDVPYLPFWIMGLVAWALLSFGLSTACVQKFRRMANRLAVAPDRDPMPRCLPPPIPRQRRSEHV